MFPKDLDYQKNKIASHSTVKNVNLVSKTKLTNQNPCIVMPNKCFDGNMLLDLVIMNRLQEQRNKTIVKKFYKQYNKQQQHQQHHQRQHNKPITSNQSNKFKYYYQKQFKSHNNNNNNSNIQSSIQKQLSNSHFKQNWKIVLQRYDRIVIQKHLKRQAKNSQKGNVVKQTQKFKTHKKLFNSSINPSSYDNTTATGSNTAIQIQFQTNNNTNNINTQSLSKKNLNQNRKNCINKQKASKLSHQQSYSSQSQNRNCRNQQKNKFQQYQNKLNSSNIDSNRKNKFNLQAEIDKAQINQPFIFRDQDLKKFNRQTIDIFKEQLRQSKNIENKNILLKQQIQQSELQKQYLSDRKIRNHSLFQNNLFRSLDQKDSRQNKKIKQNFNLQEQKIKANVQLKHIITFQMENQSNENKQKMSKNQIMDQAKANQRFAITQFSFYNENKNKNLTRHRLKKRSNSTKLKLKDFFKIQEFYNDKIAQGKIGQYSSESITVLKDNNIVYQLQGNISRQIASLTKIMTCLTVLYLCKKFDINGDKSQIKISRKASQITGTSANLKFADILTVNQLLYGMMLPSGNDAAYALAQYFGRLAYKDTQDYQKMIQKRNIMNVENLISNIIQRRGIGTPSKQIIQNQISKEDARLISGQMAINQFIIEMNKMTKYINLKDTNFSNSHGLSDQNNKSTSNDISKLCYYAMKNNQFRQIVKTKEYSLKIFNDHKKMKRQECWYNTNKLLQLQNCFGIKTGITPNAGPCMTAYFQKQGKSIIIVLLKTKSKNSRFNQIKKLYEWVLQNCQKH